MQQTFVPPERGASSAEPATAETAEFEKKNPELWFLLATATKGAAASVVMRFEQPTPNGRGAWLELERIWGGRAEDERAAQLLKLEGKARRLTCESAGGLQALLIAMYQLWSDLEALGEERSDAAKRAAILEAIRESYPHLFAQLASQPDTKYEQVRRGIISAASFEAIGTENQQQSMAMSAQGLRSGRSSGAAGDSGRLAPDQCAFCLEKPQVEELSELSQRGCTSSETSVYAAAKLPTTT